MKKFWVFGIILLGLGFLPHQPILADEIKTIQLVSGEWQGYTNQDGTGLYWEVVKAVFESTGIEVKTEVLPWKRAVYHLKKGRADVLVGDYYSKEKDGREFLYPNWHLAVEEPMIIVFKKGMEGDWDANKINSLNGKTVGWIRGYDFDKTLLKNIRVDKHEISKLKSALRMLEKGRLTALIDYKSGVLPAAKEAGINYEDVFTNKTIKSGNKLYVIFTNNARSKKLVKLYDERMNKLVRSGEIFKIFEKWGFGKEKFSKDRYGKD